MLGLLVIICVAVLSFSTFYLFSKRTNPKKILGVYSQPSGKWFYLKYYTFLVIFYLRKLKLVINPISEKDYEKVRNLSQDPKAFDAVFFQAVTQDGFYLCGGLERRHNAKVSGLFYLVAPGLGLLESLKLPKTTLDADPDAVYTCKKFAAEGLTFTPLEPMKSWEITYNAPMKLCRKPDKIIHVKFEAKFSSDLPYFLFERDVNAKTLARAMAAEIWSKDFFKNLKTAHQTHYEQMGEIRADLQIGSKKFSLKMDAFRDHSFGNRRDWSLMHRYIFHMFYLEDGTKISFGVVSQPCTTSNLELGYVVTPQKTLRTIEKSDLKLYQHAENCENLPKHYAFTFETNSDVYEAQIEVKHEDFHYKGDDVEAFLVERFITCEINGMKGRGISEWHYNNLKK